MSSTGTNSAIIFANIFKGNFGTGTSGGGSGVAGGDSWMNGEDFLSLLVLYKAFPGDPTSINPYTFGGKRCKKNSLIIFTTS
jgi:hypothetical protein